MVKLKGLELNLYKKEVRLEKKLRKREFLLWYLDNIAERI